MARRRRAVYQPPRNRPIPTTFGPRPNAFTPFVAPTRPPPNTYDPALDAQLRASQRGLGDLTGDVTKGGERSLSDYLLATGELGTQRQRGLADIMRERTQFGEDIATQRTRGGEDYGRSIQELNRRYGILGNQQTQAARQAGVVSGGGALAQAMQKRQANEAFERQPIDVGFRRFGEDIGRREQRFGEGSRLQEQRFGEDIDRRLGALGVDYGRGVEDRETQLARAGREATEFGLDIGQQRFFQARQGGYVPPTAPAGERTRHGLTFRVKGQGAQRTYTLPSGRQFSRPDWVRFVRRRRGG